MAGQWYRWARLWRVTRVVLTAAKWLRGKFDSCHHPNWINTFTAYNRGAIKGIIGLNITTSAGAAGCNTRTCAHKSSIRGLYACHRQAWNGWRVWTYIIEIPQYCSATGGNTDNACAKYTSTWNVVRQVDIDKGIGVVGGRFRKHKSIKSIKCNFRLGGRPEP